MLKSDEISSEEKIIKAINFHLNNSYPLKINNISLYGEAGSLNKALKEYFGFVLDKK